MTWIKTQLMLWLAGIASKRLANDVPAELQHLAMLYMDDPAISAAIAVLRGVVDPKVRTLDSTQAMRRLCAAIQVRTDASEGKLDDAGLLLLRGLLNAFEPASPEGPASDRAKL